MVLDCTRAWGLRDVLTSGMLHHSPNLADIILPAYWTFVHTSDTPDQNGAAVRSTFPVRR